jgi:hypothetical protein
MPEPGSFKTHASSPDAAFYHSTLNEYLLPYEAVRAAQSPDGAISAFVASTHDAAATLGSWDRAALERPREPVHGDPSRRAR